MYNLHQKLAIIRIRGKTGIRKEIKTTLNLLRLYNKHHLVLVDKTPVNIGKLKRIKDYVTWGEITQDTLKELLKQRARLPGNKPLTEQYLKEKSSLSIDELSQKLTHSQIHLRQIPGLKPFFRLKPPRGGFEKQGIKLPYSMHGSLGYRGENINILIKKML